MARASSARPMGRLRYRQNRRRRWWLAPVVADKPGAFYLAHRREENKDEEGHENDGVDEDDAAGAHSAQIPARRKL